MPNRFKDKLRAFLLHDLWHFDPHELTRRRLFLMRQLQVATIVVRGFVSDGCMLRASALTYATLLSIVPLLALMFSLIKGFGGQNVLEPLLFKIFTHGSGEVVGAILSYIENTNFRRLGTVGLVILVATVLTLLSNIEKSFNHIWGVKETRSLTRRFADYFSVVLLSPLLIVAALSLTTTLRNQVLVQRLLETAVIGEALLLLFNVLPYLAVWAAFTFMYLFMPNTRVQLGPALVGGVFGGTLWQLAQWAYVNFQIGVSKYNAIYGTMAALPILIVWLYVSWMIVLLGLELTYAMQNATILREEYSEEPVSFASLERVAMTILLLCSASFYANDTAWNHARLCSELKLPPRLVRCVLENLVRLGLLARVQVSAEDGFVYHPGRAPENIEVTAVLQALREDGSTQPRNFRMPGRELVTDIEETLLHAQNEALEGLTFRDLALRKLESGPGGAALQEG